jgi:hypothetical protein
MTEQVVLPLLFQEQCVPRWLSVRRSGFSPGLMPAGGGLFSVPVRAFANIIFLHQCPCKSSRCPRSVGLSVPAEAIPPFLDSSYAFIFPDVRPPLWAHSFT